ncbi:MAG TPA: PAS domain S-box protein, partial [Chitinophagales bacterium]|nr:PAS domain S-box protein [Chitinophagales bacterium]
MKFNTALGFILISFALLFEIGVRGIKLPKVSKILSVVAMLFSCLILAQDVFGLNLHIDEFFIVDNSSSVLGGPPPGRMSQITAFCFMCMGLFTLTLRVSNQHFRLVMQGLLHLVTLLAFLAIAGYILGVPAFYKLSVLSTMALHTSVSFFILSIAGSFINHTVGITGLFTGPQIGSVMARSVFVQSVIAVLVLAYLRILAHRYELVSVEFGIAMFAISFILTTLFILWRASRQLNLVELQKSEMAVSLERTMVFLDSSPDPVVIVDATGMIRMVSKQAELVFGYPREEMLGKPVEMLIPERYRSKHPGYRHSFFASSGARAMGSGIELFALKKNGSEFQVEISLSPIESSDGVFVSAAIRDVSERKKVEQQLKEVTERLLIATATSSIGVWDLDVVNNKLVWDESMFKLYGISKHTFAGVYEAWEKGLHPDDLERASTDLKEALAGNKEFDTEFRVVWPDGSVHFIKARAAVYRNTDGEPVRMLGTNLDVTDRKKFEAELKKSNERNRIFVEQAPNALAMFDTEMRYMAASRKWLEDYNLVGKNIIGYSHYEIFPEIGDDWKAIHRECLNGAINQTEEAPFERADGTLQWITWDVRPWYITAGQIGGLLMYTADITHIKQRDAERRRIEYILERSNQIA